MEKGVLAVDHDCLFSGHFEEKYLFSRLVSVLRQEIPGGREVVFLCIGIDRSAGDCFGPMTGTLLKQLRVPNVIGTLEEPLHAGNIALVCTGLSTKNSFVVAIDAALGSAREVGYIKIKRSPLLPASAMGKQLDPVGNISVLLNVGMGGIANYLLLQSASINMVWKGSNVLARAICAALYSLKKRE